MKKDVNAFVDDFLGEESKFNKLKNKLANKKGVTNPAAVAASIGRKKLGSKEMVAKAAAPVYRDPYKTSYPTHRRGEAVDPRNPANVHVSNDDFMVTGLDKDLHCPHCGRDFSDSKNDLDIKVGAPCPSDDCPSHDLEHTWDQND